MGSDFFRISSLTHSSPLSILTMVDMEGRSLGKSCVQRRPIFENLPASNTLISPLINLFDRFYISPFSYKFHAYVCDTLLANKLRMKTKQKNEEYMEQKQYFTCTNTFLSQVNCGILNNVLLTLCAVL